VALAQGYDVLLEKPIALTADDLLQLREVARAGTGSLTVAHVLRYTDFFATIKRFLDAGRIGDLISIVSLENIGFWHFAHSYVRGNWRRSDAASPMILTKACHDLDLIRWFAGSPCRSVSSFGELSFFRPENAPPGASLRCADSCPVESSCPYSALRIYLKQPREKWGWPVSVVSPDPNPKALLHALHTGPYGRCVFHCDNDVVDHQVVALAFANGVTAALTVSAFTAENTRTVKLMGSHGEIRGHLGRGIVEVRSFLTGCCEHVQTRGGEGHAGGDEGLMAAFLDRVRRRRSGKALPEMDRSVAESMDSYLIAFAAEESRTSGRVVCLGGI
jgi:predicted dehydrogenase